jgi:hypothetical protein
MKLSPNKVHHLLHSDRLHYTELGRAHVRDLVDVGCYAYSKETGWATLTPHGEAIRRALAELQRLGITW